MNQGEHIESLWERPKQTPRASSPTPERGIQAYRQRLVAHHEASHGVIAHQLGVPLSVVSIEQGGDSLGHVALSKRASAFDPKHMGLDEVERWVHHHGLIALAGAAGTRRFTGGDPDWGGASEDLAVMRSTLPYVATSPAERKAYENGLWREVKPLVDVNWPLIRAVAQLLIKNKTLNSRQVSDEIERAKRGGGGTG